MGFFEEHVFWPQEDDEQGERIELIQRPKERGIMMILSKKQMTEEDIKLRYITPAITAKWPLNQITMETKIR